MTRLDRLGFQREQVVEVVLADVSEPRTEVAPENAAWIDPDPFEHRPIHRPTLRRVSGHVELVPVCQGADDLVDGLCERVDLNRGHSLVLCRLRPLTRDSPLLLTEQCKGHCLGVVGCEELAFLQFQFSHSLPLLRKFSAAQPADDVDVFENLAADRLDSLVRRPHTCPVLLDHVLNQVDRYVWHGAGASLLSRNAIEVWVHRAVSSAVRHAESAAATPAENRALEVVLPMCHTLAGSLLFEYPSDNLEELVADDRLVSALVVDAFERHDACVVGIPEHPMELGDDDRLAAGLRALGRRESAAFECGSEPRQGPLACGVLLERPLDVLCPLRIDLDRVDTPAFEAPNHVRVANWGPARCAAKFGFLAHSLDRLGAEVGGVQLGDPSHDGVHEATLRGLVDVLRTRDKRCTRSLNGHRDGHIIQSVTREAVELVDDHEVDVLRSFKTLQHDLELLAIGAAGRLANVDVLGFDDCAERLSPLTTLVALCLDREALGVEVSLSLRVRRDAQIDDGSAELTCWSA